MISNKYTILFRTYRLQFKFVADAFGVVVKLGGAPALPVSVLKFTLIIY